MSNFVLFFILIQCVFSESLTFPEEFETVTIQPYNKDADLDEQPSKRNSGILFEETILPNRQIFGNRNKKNRKGEKMRKRKQNKNKNKVNKSVLDSKSFVSRNHEKASLVHNRTIEILKNGVQILSTDKENPGDSGNKTNKVNETLLEKILSSAASKSDLLISASGNYKIPIGENIYSSKKITNTFENELPQNPVVPKFNRTESREYEDDFEDWNSQEEFPNMNGTNNSDYETNKLDYNVETVLQQIVVLLQNSTTNSNCSKFFSNCSETENYSHHWHDGDPCLKWFMCRENLETVFMKTQRALPSCPCHYPSTIFYENKIWDENEERYFRWRDASSENERLDIYKPGAVYCIRSLLTHGSSSVASQNCCYDRDLRLITRGSGAGTINFVSPDVSKKLHDTVDLLPWRLCKGDFTRYNLARKPDNGNNCAVNPDDEQYEFQIELSKYF